MQEWFDKVKRKPKSVLLLLENNLHATRWLEDNELLDGGECILRRTISKEGRSPFIHQRQSCPSFTIEIAWAAVDQHSWSTTRTIS